MPKNTFLIVTLLAVFAALVIGVNLGKNIWPSPESGVPVQATPSPTAPAISPTPVAKSLYYANDTCGISFLYPEYLTKMEASDGNSVFINSRNPKESLALICQNRIPKPTGDLTTETITIGSQSATIYKESTPSAVNTEMKLILRNRKTGLDILISGAGEVFRLAVSTLKTL